MTKTKARPKLSLALSFVFTVVIGVNAIGSLILHLFGGLIFIVVKVIFAPFILLSAVIRIFLSFISFLTALFSRVIAFIVRKKRQILLSAATVMVLFSFVSAYRFTQNLPYPHTPTDILRTSQVAVYDKNKVPLYEVRSEGSYNALIESLPSTTSSEKKNVSSRFLAQTQLEGEKQNIAWFLKREIVALRIRRMFSPKEISALEAVISTPLSASAYKRAPFATNQVLNEAMHILGSQRFRRGGFIIYSTIDLTLYNTLQERLLTKIAQGDIPNQEVIITESSDGTIASINSPDLPGAAQRLLPQISSAGTVSKIVAVDGRVLYARSTSKESLSKGGDLDGN